MCILARNRHAAGFVHKVYLLILCHRWTGGSYFCRLSFCQQVGPSCEDTAGACWPNEAGDIMYKKNGLLGCCDIDFPCHPLATFRTFAVQGVLEHACCGVLAN